MFGADELVLNVVRVDLEIVDLGEIGPILLDENAIGRLLVDEVRFGHVAARQASVRRTEEEARR